jgi:hypothetical protein
VLRKHNHRAHLIFVAGAAAAATHPETDAVPIEPRQDHIGSATTSSLRLFEASFITFITTA